MLLITACLFLLCFVSWCFWMVCIVVACCWMLMIVFVICCFGFALDVFTWFVRCCVLIVLWLRIFDMCMSIACYLICYCVWRLLVGWWVVYIVAYLCGCLFDKLLFCCLFVYLCLIVCYLLVIVSFYLFDVEWCSSFACVLVCQCLWLFGYMSCYLCCMCVCLTYVALCWVDCELVMVVYVIEAWIGVASLVCCLYSLRCCLCDFGVEWWLFDWYWLIAWFGYLLFCLALRGLLWLLVFDFGDLITCLLLICGFRF